MTILRIEGLQRSVAYRAERLKLLLEKFGRSGAIVETGRELNEKMWQGVRDVGDFAKRPGAVWRSGRSSPPPKTVPVL